MLEFSVTSSRYIVPIPEAKGAAFRDAPARGIERVATSSRKECVPVSPSLSLPWSAACRRRASPALRCVDRPGLPGATLSRRAVTALRDWTGRLLDSAL